MDDGVDLPLLGFLGLGVRPALLLFPPLVSISFLPFMGLADAALVTLPLLLLPRLRSDGAFFLAGGAMSEESEPSSSSESSCRLCFFTRFEGVEVVSCFRFLECLFLLLLLYRFLEVGGGAVSTANNAFFSAGVLRRLYDLLLALVFNCLWLLGDADFFGRFSTGGVGSSSSELNGANTGGISVIISLIGSVISFLSGDITLCRLLLLPGPPVAFRGDDPLRIADDKLGIKLLRGLLVPNVLGLVR